MNPVLKARKALLAESPKERLKWQILKTFGVLPSDASAKSLDDDTLIDCALHMILDLHPCNPSFDMDEFRRQQGGGQG